MSDTRELTGDAELLREWSRVTDPLEALKAVVAGEWVFGRDPYYADLHDALMAMAERVSRAGEDK
jgi:hypothetical protein